MTMIPDVDLLYYSLKHYSPTGSTEKIAKYLVNWAKEHKMDAEFQNKMVIINPTAQTLLMLGHMDTVLGELPVVIDEDSGMITGRGAADAKGPLCAALAALERLPQLWDKVCIVAVPDEEVPSEAARYIRDHWQEQPGLYPHRRTQLDPGLDLERDTRAPERIPHRPGGYQCQHAAGQAAGPGEERLRRRHQGAGG